MPTATIDLITENRSTGEFVLILVEDGPWPEHDSDWNVCLSRIQSRIYDAIDIAVDGHLVEKYPDAKGKTIRIQIDSPARTPDRLKELVFKLRSVISTEGNEYHSAIKKSQYVSDLYIVMGHEVTPYN